MDFRRPILDDPKGFSHFKTPISTAPRWASKSSSRLRRGWQRCQRRRLRGVRERRPEKGGCVVWHGLYGKTGKKHSFFLQNGDWSEGLTAKLDFDYIINHHLIFWSCFIMYLTMSQMMCVQNWDETWSLRVNLTAGPRKIWRWALYLRGAQRPLGEG